MLSSHVGRPQAAGEANGAKVQALHQSSDFCRDSDMMGALVILPPNF